jgi:hypothetical protein
MRYFLSAILGLSFLTFAECLPVEKANEILKANGVNDVKVIKINDYSEVSLCGAVVKTAKGDEVEDAFFFSPDGKFLIPKVAKVISLDSPLKNYKAVYIVYKDKKVLIGYVNPTYKIFLPSLVALKQPGKQQNKTNNSVNKTPTN